MGTLTLKTGFYGDREKAELAKGKSEKSLLIWVTHHRSSRMFRCRIRGDRS